MTLMNKKNAEKNKKTVLFKSNEIFGNVNPNKTVVFFVNLIHITL